MKVGRKIVRGPGRHKLTLGDKKKKERMKVNRQLGRACLTSSTNNPAGRKSIFIPKKVRRK